MGKRVTRKVTNVSSEEEGDGEKADADEEEEGEGGEVGEVDENDEDDGEDQDQDQDDDADEEDEEHEEHEEDDDDDEDEAEGRDEDDDRDEESKESSDKESGEESGEDEENGEDGGDEDDEGEGDEDEEEEEVVVDANSKTQKRRDNKRKQQKVVESSEEDDIADDESEAEQSDAEGEDVAKPSALGDLLGVYAQLRTFGAQLRMSPFTVSQLIHGVSVQRENILLSEIHMCILRVLAAEHITEALEDESGRSDHTALCWLSLNGHSWPELLRRYLQSQAASPGDRRVSAMFYRYFMMLRESCGYWELRAQNKVELLSFLCGLLFDQDDYRDEIEDRSQYRMKPKTRRRASKDPSQPPESESEEEDSNADSCIICGKAGDLICCDGCPGSFRLDLLNAAQKPSDKEDEDWCPPPPTHTLSLAPAYIDYFLKLHAGSSTAGTAGIVSKTTVGQCGCTR
jgi:hypothetical protein